ncbi:MAG TPA: M20 family peptidase [bacterium]|nr:M20 family peptidase [bacterium]
MKICVPKRLAAVVCILAISLLSAPYATSASGASSAANSLSGAVKIKSISHQDPSQVDATEFFALHDYLATSYPLIHKNLVREKAGGLSLLYTWQGSDPSARPVILMAHQDVVPIAPGTIGDWTHSPFSGDIADGYVWGRGTMDCKGFLISIMEAVEGLIAEGHAPRRTIYLAFGHDEEVGGDHGAAAISSLLESRGAKAEYVIDEGGFIVDGAPLGIDKPLAMVGIAEKGYLSLELKVKTGGGHSSMPPPESAIGILGAAIHRLEKRPFPSRLEGVTVLTFESLAPEMPASMRAAISGRRLLGGVIKNMLSKVNATNAMIRTTTAATIIEAGSKENVLPQEARAVVNLRLLPGDDIAYAVGRVKKVIADPRVAVEIMDGAREASKVSSVESDGFKILKTTIAEVFPGTLMAPFLVLGGTDSRHYENISDSVYRFIPMRVSEKDQERAHGTDERIAVDNIEEIIEFYRRLILNSE